MKSKKRAFFFTLLLLMVCVVVQAQSLQVEGTVISKSDGEPIIGATIKEKGTSNGTISDFDGNFVLEVSPSSVLEISYIGYQSQTIKSDGSQPLSITVSSINSIYPLVSDSRTL